MPKSPEGPTRPASIETIDVLVVGGGPGGTPAAMALAQAGKRVLLVESGLGLGGTCLFSGCIPSKIFRETAVRRQEILGAAEFGLDTGTASPPRVDWAAVQARRHRILAQRSGGALATAKGIPTLEVAFGRARLTGPRDAVIDRAGQPPRKVRFGNAILATGSVPRALPVPGADLPGVLDSDRLIDLTEVPTSLALIGGGPIGIEMAQIFAALGAEVTILEASPHILGPVDRVLAGLLQDHLSAQGIRVETGVAVTQIAKGDDGHRVDFQRDGQTGTVRAQVVAIVAGRVPNVAQLGLEATAIQHGPHGVVVDAHLETQEPGIFATGDLVGHPMFAHWATAQALAVAGHLLGKADAFPRPEHNSAVIFSRPEFGMVGLTLEEAQTRGIDAGVAEYNYRIDARAQIDAAPLGRLRIVFNRADHRILGVHVMADGAADLMGEAALAVRTGMRLEQLATTIHPHPTLTEAFGLTARMALR